MSTNIEQFNAVLRDWAKNKPKEIVTKAQRKLALEALSRIVMRTPVDTGRARGNWQVTIDMPARGEANVGDPVSAGRGVIDKSPAFCTIWITNNVPYITVLEYGLFDPENPGPNKHGQVLVSGGFSVQAPHGMVGVTLGDLRAMF